MALVGTRDKILSVASKLFSRYGFHKTSMDEIAKNARKAKGSLYYHFSSKEDLFKEIVLKEIINLKSQLSLIIASNKLSASEKIKNYFNLRMKILHEASTYNETLKADFFEHFDFIDGIRKDFDEWEKVNIKIIFNQGIDSKEFLIKTDIDKLVDIYIMVLKGLEIPLFVQEKYDDYVPSFNGLSDIFIKGLST
jgi:AcrR family transcriptional regulator